MPLRQQKIILPPEIYRLEAFASTDAGWVSNCIVFVKFDLAQGTNGYVAVDVNRGAALRVVDRQVVDDQGRVLVMLDDRWKWERGLAITRLKPGDAACLAISTLPLVAADADRFALKSEIRNPKSNGVGFRRVLRLLTSASGPIALKPGADCWPEA